METQISLFDAEKVQRQEAEMEKAFQEWSRLPDEVQIPADDPIRPKVASMLRRGYGIIYGQALHRCPGLPAGKHSRAVFGGGVMKNRTTVQHGTLPDLKAYLVCSGWTLEPPVGAYEVLRARRPGYPRPLLVHDRSTGGCGYSIDERDMKVYAGRKKNRRKRGLPADATIEERKEYWHEKD